MQVLQKGVEYLLDTSETKYDNQKVLHITFCHKNVEGRFINGAMAEEFMRMMINRYSYLIEKDSSEENIKTLLFLKQAYQEMDKRNHSKMEKKRNNDGTGNGIPVQAPGSKG